AFTATGHFFARQLSPDFKSAITNSFEQGSRIRHRFPRRIRNFFPRLGAVSAGSGQRAAISG
ncbi:MAG: hypothetical protein ACJ799_05745, partial [Gemmatimonadaceae bacterium]